MKRVKSVFAITAAVCLLFTGCSTGQEERERTGSTLAVSLEHSYSSEQIPMEKGADALLAYGENLIVSSYGEEGRMCYSLYSPENGEMQPVTLQYYETLVGDDSYISGLFTDAEGNLHVMYEIIPEDSDDIGRYHEIYDQNMELLSAEDITERMDAGYSAYGFTADSEGHIYAILTDANGTSSVGIFDADLQQLGSCSGDWQFVRYLTAAQDGAVYVCYNDNQSRLIFGRVNPDAGTIEPIKLDVPFSSSPHTGCLTGSGEYDFCFFDNTALYGVKSAEGICEEIVNWFNSDFIGDYIMNAAFLQDGRIAISVYDLNYVNCDVWLLTERSEADIESMQIISLATMQMPLNLKNAITVYNRTNKEYRIVAKNYGMTGDTYDYESGLEVFKADMTSGVVADIICTENIPYESFAAKGIFEDLSRFLEEDKDFDPDDYFMNYFDSLKYGEHLYRIGNSFIVETVAAKSEFVGEESALSFDEMRTVMDTYADSMEVFPNMTREKAVRMFCCESMRHFVDVDKASCRFDTADFVALLECCALFPPHAELVYQDTAMAFRNDEALFWNTQLQKVEQYHELTAGTFGTDAVTLTGYPTPDGEGNGGIFYSDFTLAMCAESRYQAQIWEFMKLMLSEKMQDQLQWELPVHRGVMADRMDEAMEDMKYVTSRGETVTIPRQYLSIDIGNATQQEMDDLTAYIEGISACNYYDYAISNVIIEEAEMYFAGDCTAQEAVSRIQSRVSIYLSEQQ